MWFLRSWFCWLLVLVFLVPPAIGMLDPTGKVSEHEGVVQSLIPYSPKQTPVSNVWHVYIQVENGAVFSETVSSPERYRAGQKVKVFRYQKKYTRLVSWRLS